MATGKQESLDALLGAVIADRFHLESVLGVGAMAVVFAARSVQGANVGDRVALKIVLPGSTQRHNVSRLIRGARLTARVHHPNVVETRGYGRVGPDSDGYYVAMELVDGVSLDRLASAPLDAAALCTLTGHVLQALAHVHARGILHRDIKPENVMVTRADDGSLTAKLSDFGIAAETVPDATHVTAPGIVVGTPAYMAPEQMGGRGLDRPTLDLYPVGVMLYEMLSGSLPFPSKSLASLMPKMAKTAPRLVPRGDLDVTPGMIDVAMRLIARLPDDRYLMAADAYRDLEPHCGPAQLSADDWDALRTASRPWDIRDLPAGWGRAREALALSADRGSDVASGSGPIRAASSGESGETRSRPGAERIERDVRIERAERAEANRRRDLHDRPTASGPTRVAPRGSGPHRAHADPAAPLDELPLVGREALLRRIDAIAGEAEHGQGRAVLLAGPIGIGKTSVLNAAAARLAETGRFLVMRGAFHTASSTRDSLRHALEGVLGTTGMARNQVAQVVAEFLRRHGDDDPDESRDLLAFLRPTGDRVPDQAHTFALLTRCLRRLSHARPLLLALDDFHHGDADAGAFFEFLMFQVGRDPFPLLVLITRCTMATAPALDAVMAKTARLEGAARHTLAIAPIDEAELASALSRYLGASPTRARSIARRAAGNPLFALHLLRMPGDAGVASLPTDSSGGVPLALSELLALSVEQGVQASGEPDKIRALLEAIAILGPAVQVSLLEAFLDDDQRGRLDCAIDLCLDHGLLTWVEADDAEIVAFSPSVVGEVVRWGLNPRRARRLHRRAIEVRQAWAESRGRLDAEAGAIGDHCEALGRRDDAVDWWLRGQRFERRGGDALRGLDWAHKALRAMPPDDPRYGSCAIDLGHALLDAGELDDAAAVLEPVLDGADPDLALRAGDVLGDVYENAGRGDDWTRIIERMSALEDAAGPEGRRALYAARSFWSNNRGSRDDGLRDAERALDGAAAGPEAQRALQRLAFSHLFHGDVGRAEKLALRAIEESGDRLDLRARSVRLLGLVYLHLGEPALACHKQVLDMCRRSGLIARIPITLLDLGDACMVTSQMDDAQRYYEDALRAAVELGMNSTRSIAQHRLLALDILAGRTDDIVERIDDALGEATRSAVLPAPRFYRWIYIGAHIALGHNEQALAELRELETELGHLPYHPIVAVALGHAIQTLRDRHGEDVGLDSGADAPSAVARELVDELLRWRDRHSEYMSPLSSQSLHSQPCG